MERIRLADRAEFQDGKMARHRLAATSHLHADLYCLRPGQTQLAHVHAEQDKLYVGLSGRTRIRVGEEIEWLEPGMLVVAPAGAEHGLENPTVDPAVVLVVVAPPPPHA